MGLKQNDLENMVYDIVSIDEYSSKMGDDENITTLSFQVKSEPPANDLCDFLEKGYKFILDADVSPGEITDGNYLVFAELERNEHVATNIFNILNDVKKLSNIDEFKFRYYKQFRSKKATLNLLKKYVPNDAENYGISIKRSSDNYFEFFDKSKLVNIKINENKIHFNSNNKKMSFNIVDFGTIEQVQHHLTEKFDIMESYPEILHLTKYIGDYNISKYGTKFVFENKDNFLILEK